MKTSQILFVLLLFLLPFPGAFDAQAQEYTGTFQIETGGITFTLNIQQDANNMLTGTLQRSSGSAFNLQGMVAEGAAAGVISGSEGQLFFEAYLDGNDLTLSLIEPDQYNMPNYDSAEYLVFNRSQAQAQQFQAPVAVQPPVNSQVPAPTQPPVNMQATAPGPSKTLPDIKPGSGQVRDVINGYSFNVPDGWVHQQSDGQILLGSHTIAGIISVSPHQAKSMQELQGLVLQGLQEEGIYLMPDGSFQHQAQNRISGYYRGSVQGEQARGYLNALLSPHGGGLYILALSTPEKLGQDIEAAANFLASNTQFIKRETGDADLVKHFAGEWAWSNGYRSEWMTFFPDGTFSDQSEASYSGNMADGSGNVTGNWGVAGENSSRGRWNIQGTIDSGVITVISPDGTQTRYEYNVFMERGEKYYREYMFNRYHYRKQKNF